MCDLEYFSNITGSKEKFGGTTGDTSKQKLQDHFNQWFIEEKKTPWKYADVGARFVHRLNQTQSHDEDVFFDTWHLSTNGHKQYAKYAEQYDWGI